jgi:hypothetical protein
MEQLERKLPSWIDAFLKYTENTEPPFLFRKWTAISCIAAAMQRKCHINWGTALMFYPNLYIVLVGPSATGKGTAMSPGLDIIGEIPSIRLAAQSTSLQALIQKLKKTNLTDTDMITGKQKFHSSMTIFSKEFTVFLGYHNNELMAALCDWYDCDNRWSYETVSRGKDEVIGVWVNLIGGTTPSLISSSLPLESIGGGLTSRIIFVCEEKKGKLVTMPIQTEEEMKLRQLLIHDLEKVSMLSGEFSYTEGFANLWDQWCRQAENNPPFFNSKFDGYTGRRRTHLMKLSMIISASHGEHDLVVTKDDLETAIEYLYEVEKKMESVFKGVGQSDIAPIVNRVTVFLMNSPRKNIPLDEFARYFADDIDRATFDRVIQTLEMGNIAKLVNVPSGQDYIQIMSGLK